MFTIRSEDLNTFAGTATSVRNPDPADYQEIRLFGIGALSKIFVLDVCLIGNHLDRGQKLSANQITPILFSITQSVPFNSKGVSPNR